MRPLPPIGPPRALPRLDVHHIELRNGMRLLAVERRELPIADIEFVMMPGAFADSPEQAGRVSMVAEMLDEGTPQRTTLEIAEQFDLLGAQLDLRAGWDALAASVHVVSDRLPQTLDIAADVLLNASFPEREFKRKQEERIGTLRQERDEAAMLAGKALGRAIFGSAHPYGAPVYGTVASISRLTRADVHGLYQGFTRKQKTTIVAAGDFDVADLVQQLEQRLTGWPQEATHSLPEAVSPAPTDTRILLVDKPGAEQAELRVGHSAPRRDTPDYFAILVLNTILGGSFTSRLNTVLRERMGVTYGASSHFRMRRNGGVFSAGSAVFTESAARSAQVVIEEMTRMIEEPVPADELRRAQSYLALGLPRQFESSEDIAAHLREQVLYDLPAEHWQDYVDNVFSVTAQDVAAAAARHLQPGHSTIVVAADAKQVRNALEQAGLGPVIDTVVES